MGKLLLLCVVLCGPFSRLFLMVVGRALACVCFGSFGRVVVSCQWPPAPSHHIVFQANTMVRGGVLLLFASLKAFGLYYITRRRLPARFHIHKKKSAAAAAINRAPSRHSDITHMESRTPLSSSSLSSIIRPFAPLLYAVGCLKRSARACRLRSTIHTHQIDRRRKSVCMNK